MNKANTTPINAKKVFRQCGTCSRTFAHILNKEFGHPKENEERALDQLAGGVMNKGHQCGMLWGAVLAAGAESYRQYDDIDQATITAIQAARHIMKSFTALEGTVNCKEIIGYDLSSRWGLFRYMTKVTLQGMDNSHCFKLADEWAELAIQSAKNGLSEVPQTFHENPLSCSAELVKHKGGSEEEAAMVAGFAGGMGLSGNACGALSAMIWLKMLEWHREHPDKTPPYLNNPVTKRIMNKFLDETGGTLRCDEITGLNFKSQDDHSVFIKNGGCSRLIKLLGEL